MRTTDFYYTVLFFKDIGAYIIYSILGENHKKYLRFELRLIPNTGPGHKRSGTGRRSGVTGAFTTDRQTTRPTVW